MLIVAKWQSGKKGGNEGMRGLLTDFYRLRPLVFWCAAKYFVPLQCIQDTR